MRRTLATFRPRYAPQPALHPRPARLPPASAGLAYETPCSLHPVDCALRPQPDGATLFFENFDDQASFDKVWTISSNADFQGRWGLSEGNNGVQVGDMGLEVKDEAKKHGAPTQRPAQGLA